MKPVDIADELADRLRLDGFLIAVHLLVARHLAYATAHDLVRTDAADAPPFLVSPRLPHDVHVRVRLIRETLASLVADNAGARGA